MQLIALSDLLEQSEESVVRDYLSSFSCKKSREVETFLKGQAIDNEGRIYTRTFLVVDETNDDAIVGYFTLRDHQFEFGEQISGSKRQKLTNDKHAKSLHTILIAQLRSDDKYKGIFSGSELLGEALNACNKVFK